MQIRQLQFLAIALVMVSIIFTFCLDYNIWTEGKHNGKLAEAFMERRIGMDGCGHYDEEAFITEADFLKWVHSICTPNNGTMVVNNGTDSLCSGIIIIKRVCWIPSFSYYPRSVWNIRNLVKRAISDTLFLVFAILLLSAWIALFIFTQLEIVINENNELKKKLEMKENAKEQEKPAIEDLKEDLAANVSG